MLSEADARPHTAPLLKLLLLGYPAMGWVVWDWRRVWED